MLAKLMKYEIKATSRWFLPLYGTILIFALINKFTFINPLVNNPAAFNNKSFASVIKGIMSVLPMFIFVMLFVGIFVTTLIVVIQRFYKNLLGDEGYLMFTLPVKAWQHILSKLLVSMLWYLFSSIVALCSILILIPGETLKQITYALGILIEFLGLPSVIILVLCVVTTLIMGILEIYSAISLGHLFNKHKLLLSFAMYLGISMINQFVYSLVIFLVLGIAYIPFNAIGDITISFRYVLNILTILSVIFSVGHFCLTSYLIKRKLNLE